MSSPIAERPARQGAVTEPTSIESAENAEEAEAAAVYQVAPTNSGALLKHFISFSIRFTQLCSCVSQLRTDFGVSSGLFRYSPSCCLLLCSCSGRLSNPLHDFDSSPGIPLHRADSSKCGCQRSR
jgi:hypothetical protein